MSINGYETIATTVQRTTLTVGDLRRLIAWAEQNNVPDTETIRLRVDPGDRGPGTNGIEISHDKPIEDDETPESRLPMFSRPRRITDNPQA